MSYIFDALQRSEASRKETGTPGSLTAIELLERAERAAAYQSKVEAELVRPERLEPDRPNAIFGPDRLGRVPDSSAVAAVTQALESDRIRECFSQFQTVKGSPATNSHLVCLTDADAPAAEAFRLLGVRLRQLRSKRELKGLLITSALPEEGKSMVSANLACTLASGNQQKVLLIEGDVRRPSLATMFGFSDAAGLSDCLEGELSIVSCIYHLEEPGIWILPAGGRSGGHVEVIHSTHLQALLQQLYGWFDWIVIDSPPVLPLADTSVWQRLSDGILLVSRRGVTKKRRLEKGLEALDHNKLIGGIVNSSRSIANGDYYYYRTKAENSGTSKGDAD